MTRRIVTTRMQAAGEQAAPDDFGARIVKYIPADVVAAWVALVALVPASAASRTAVLWGCFALLLVITPFWMTRVTTVAGEPVARTQALMATLAFAVWAFATGIPFSLYAFYEPWMGGVLLILFTFFSGLVDPDGFKKAHQPAG
jgi:hypothetical protein